MIKSRRDRSSTWSVGAELPGEKIQSAVRDGGAGLGGGGRLGDGGEAQRHRSVAVRQLAETIGSPCKFKFECSGSGQGCSALGTLNGDSAAQQGAIGSSSGAMGNPELSAELIKRDLRLSVTAAPAAGPLSLPSTPSRA